MTTLEKLKRALWSLARKGLKRKKAGVKLAGYFNGFCPYCGEHIGSDVYLDLLTRQLYCFCGACDRDVFSVPPGVQIPAEDLRLA